MENTVSKWHMHRMGLIDFWYYVNEEFYFKDGHMLLRGSNGSGKSVTMQSFLPLLLDGNKSSERLDPFGTRSRKMENYLLEDNGERNDRIGYLYLEFKREHSDVYKTIGMGMHARVGKPLDTWYFVIENNQRINRDVFLMEHNIAISKQVLKNRIGEDQLIETQSEYMNRVNQALFGFETLDAYKEAINLLLQLRSPKLSNSLRPTKINEILSASLQPLSEDDLRPMSEAISNMDNLKDQLDALKQSVISAKAIYQVYDAYNHALLFEKHEAYVKQQVKTQQLAQQYQQIKEDLQKIKQEYEDCEVKLVTLKNENALLVEEKNSLGNDNMQQLVEEVQCLQEDIKSSENQCLDLENRYDEKANQLQDVRVKYDEYVKKADRYAYEIQRISGQLEELQETINFEDYALLHTELFEHIDQSYNFDYIKNRINDKIKKLQAGLREFEYFDLHKMQYEEALQEQEKHIQSLQEQEKKVAKLETQYDMVIEECREIMSQWVAQNTILCFSNTEIIEMMNILDMYEEEQSFYKLNAFVQDAYSKLHKRLIAEEVQIQQDRTNAVMAYEEKNNEYVKWKNQKEAQPQQRMTQQKNREYLRKEGIAYVPFYKLLDFADDVPQNVKDCIEEALLNMGVLDALLVEETYRQKLQREGMEDSYFFVKQDVEKLPIYTIKGADMEEAEHSFLQILTELGQRTEDYIHFTKQYYQNGVLYGTLSQTSPAIYIGIKARQEHREKMMMQLEKECKELQGRVWDIEQLLTQCKEKQKLLEDEKQTFLKEDDLHFALTEWKNEEYILERMYLQNKEIEKNIDQKREIVKRSGKALQKMGQDLGIRVQKDAFKEILASFDEFKILYDDLQVQHISYIYQLDLQHTQATLQEDLIRGVDELQYSLETAIQQKTKMTKLFEQKQRQLQDMGYEDICRRLKEIERRLQQLPKEIEDIVYMLAHMEATKKNLLEQQKEKETALSIQTETTEKFYQILLDEVGLGYVQLALQEDLNRQIEALKATRGIHKRSEILKNELQTVYFTQRGNLQEYQLTITSSESAVEEFALRIDVQAKYKGKKIAFQELLELLQRDVDLQSNLLEDSDRHLFEDILVNTISKKIRLRIFNSRNWIAKMNRYIDSMNTSSGLLIHLQWKSKKAENDEELDTKQLVDLLEKEPRMLKDADVKKLSSHFRSKIATARKLQSLEDNTLSFHQLMRQVMDYREWYEFKILAQKPGEPKKELTNTAFYAYSGGEKAMTMYVPLFSAVAAKFESAREEAPLLIALDEAFAGVDEKNIDSMFSLIAKCKFDYIMNSQVLWGDYPSVSGLAIYELFRPENARYVTVIPYEWDGHVKKMKVEI